MRTEVVDGDCLQNIDRAMKRIEDAVAKLQSVTDDRFAAIDMRLAALESKMDSVGQTVQILSDQWSWPHDITDEHIDGDSGNKQCA